MRADNPEPNRDRAERSGSSESDELLELIARAYAGEGPVVPAGELRRKVLAGVALWADLAVDEASRLVNRIDQLAANHHLIKTAALQDLLDGLCALTLRDG